MPIRKSTEFVDQSEKVLQVSSDFSESFSPGAPWLDPEKIARDSFFRPCFEIEAILHISILARCCYFANMQYRFIMHAFS